MEDTKAVVAYCRVSTLEQRKNGHGIDIQLRDVRRFAENLGLCVHHFYRDEGESGVREDRRQLRRLLRHCKAGRVGTLIIPSPDRLSRDLRLSENLFWEFGRLGIQVLIADMPNYKVEDRRDVLIRQIRAAIAEENRKEIIERLWKGRQERTRRGEVPGGNVPYGFRRKNKKFLADTHEAEIIRLVFGLVNKRASNGAIAVALNAQGLRRRNGTEWNARQVRSIVANREFYEKGTIRYGEVCVTDEKLILLGKTERNDISEGVDLAL